MPRGRLPVKPGDPLTQRQEAILLFLMRHMMRFGRMPTLRDIMREFGMRSPHGVRCHLRLIAGRKLIRWAKQRACAIRLEGVRWQPVFDDSPAGQTLRELYERI